MNPGEKLSNEELIAKLEAFKSSLPNGLVKEPAVESPEIQQPNSVIENPYHPEFPHIDDSLDDFDSDEIEYKRPELDELYDEVEQINHEYTLHLELKRRQRESEVRFGTIFTDAVKEVVKSNIARTDVFAQDFIRSMNETADLTKAVNANEKRFYDEFISNDLDRLGSGKPKEMAEVLDLFSNTPAMQRGLSSLIDPFLVDRHLVGNNGGIAAVLYHEVETLETVFMATLKNSKGINDVSKKIPDIGFEVSDNMEANKAFMDKTKSYLKELPSTNLQIDSKKRINTIGMIDNLAEKPTSDKFFSTTNLLIAGMLYMAYAREVAKPGSNAIMMNRYLQYRDIFNLIAASVRKSVNK